MKLFFDLDGFVFVVGLDQAVVERVIDVKYRTEGGTSNSPEATYQIRGADYIKKIFQLPYAVAPVAITQLNEFLNAVYSEAQLPPDQEEEFRSVVGPHLRFLVTESGVNPREIKRYLNAYTLVIKIKPRLEKDVVLTFQTIAFRRDWEIVRRAILSYRAIFTNVVKRQISGQLSAISDLDPSLEGIPDSFISYVSQGNPGSALLSVPNLDEYIYTGEATTSSRGSVFIDVIRDVAQLSKALKGVKGGRPDGLTNYKKSVESVMSMVSEVTNPQGLSLERWRVHLSSYDNDREQEWMDQEEGFRRRILNHLMELYQAGSQSSK